jgi:hypothetical protein
LEFIYLGADDIYKNTNIGLATKIKIDNLDGKLFHDNTYFITVTAINSAGLTATKSCNITVETEAPDISNLKVTVLLGKLDRRGVYTTTNSKGLGVSWTGGRSDVEFYGKEYLIMANTTQTHPYLKIGFLLRNILSCFLEWQVGSSPHGDDIFPRVKIGLQDSKKATIERGKLHIDDKSLNTSIGEYAKQNWTAETMKKAKANTFFNMEPGLCLYITLFAVGRSHLSSSRELEPFCIKRKIIAFTTFLHPL